MPRSSSSRGATRCSTCSPSTSVISAPSAARPTGPSGSCPQTAMRESVLDPRIDGMRGRSRSSLHLAWSARSRLVPPAPDPSSAIEELNPPPVDPEWIDPGPEAEPIAALTFLLELPHCLRIDNLVFLVSDRGGGWAGWNPHAIGHMAGFDRAVPEDDLKPRF